MALGPVYQSACTTGFDFLHSQYGISYTPSTVLIYSYYYTGTKVARGNRILSAQWHVFCALHTIADKYI